MARTKQTARKSTGGKAPHHTEAVPPVLSLGVGKGISKESLTRGKGGKGLGKADLDLTPSPIRLPTSIALGKGKASSMGKGISAGKGGKVYRDDDDENPEDVVVPTDAPAATGPAPDAAEKTAELIASFTATSSKIDVVFAFDTTGSMYCYLAEVRKRIHESVSRLHRDIPEIRIGVMAVGDYCDQFSSYVIKSLDLTRDIDSLVTFITGVQPSGGGDAPEAYELALQTARSFTWEAEPGNRALVMIGDSNPHPPSYTTANIWWRDELAGLVDEGVKVYGVQCNATLPTRYFYEEMAAVSGGGYLSLAATSCITDMFLAVCYRQVSQSALEAFCEDAEKSGGDIEAKRRLFGQLKSAAPTNSVKRCTADWYDKAYDHGTPAYKREGASWVPYLGPPSTPVRPSAPRSSPAPIETKRRRSVRG